MDMEVTQIMVNGASLRLLMFTTAVPLNISTRAMHKNFSATSPIQQSVQNQQHSQSASTKVQETFDASFQHLHDHIGSNPSIRPKRRRLHPSPHLLDPFCSSSTPLQPSHRNLLTSVHPISTSLRLSISTTSQS